MKRTFVLTHKVARERAVAAVAEAPEGFAVTVGPKKRSLDQNAKFHAICYDLAKSGAVFMGKQRDASQWKVLLVSGHAVATKQEVDFVVGIEGEYVNLRESTALMSKDRGSSLIEYAIAYCASIGVEVS